MDLRYYHSISVGALQYCQRNRMKYKGFNFEPYGEGSFFHHPYQLISAGHCHKDMDYRENIGASKKDAPRGHIMGDSGGFQIRTGNLKQYAEAPIETRELIFQWLENNTDIAINLDIPPYSSKIITSKVFNECLEQSYDNFTYFNERQTGKTDFLNVLQGRSIDQITTWYNKVKDFDFSGWSIGSAANAMNSIISIKFLLDKGALEDAKYLHILGISSAVQLIYLSDIQIQLEKRGLNVQMSTDSSSPSLASGYARYFQFLQPTSISTLTLQRHINITSDMNPPCKCPVCSQVEGLDEFVGGKSINYALMATHNLYKLIEYIDVVQSILKLDSHDIYQSIFGMKVAKNFKVIEKCFGPKDESLQYLQQYMKYTDVPLVPKQGFEEFFT